MGLHRLVAYLLLFLFPVVLYADADLQDWIGEYAMNQDGHLGTLRIVASKRKCRSLPCPGLEAQYVDERGAAYSGSVDVLDQNGQHITFTVELPGVSQIFNLYIFSVDKTKLAGTMAWGNRTFGVSATRSGVVPPMAAGPSNLAVKRPAIVATERARVGIAGIASGTPPSGTPSGTPTRVLQADGTIELHYPDGTVRSKKIGQCGWGTRYADGHFVPPMCTFAAVIPLVPPPPPSGSPEEIWLKGQDVELLGILQKILGGADSSNFQNYTQNYENPPDPAIYKRIYFRTAAIFEFSSIP
jgi:hypothetical protein